MWQARKKWHKKYGKKYENISFFSPHHHWLSDQCVFCFVVRGTPKTVILNVLFYISDFIH